MCIKHVIIEIIANYNVNLDGVVSAGDISQMKQNYR